MTQHRTTTGELLADARALWSRERSLIVAVGAPFLFLPAFAVKLLTSPMPPPPAERSREAYAAWFDALGIWGEANAGWYFLADAILVFGVAALTVLLIDPARPTVAAALMRAARLWPRFLLASVLASVPVGLGMVLVIPGLFFQARLIAAVPALAVEQPLAASVALMRSWQTTAGASGTLFGCVALLLALQWLALGPFTSFDTWLRTPAHLNPFVLALVDAAMSAITALYQVALLLVGIAAYRRLAS